MAGAGVRLFTAGSQLLASQINDYLMDQVVAYFTDSAARDAAFGGIGEPSLSPGKICYLFSDNKLYLYGNDNQWTEIGAQIDDLEVTTGKLADGAVTSTKILDGTILNIDINASAAIALTKLATGTIGTVVLHNASGVPTATALSGDVTVTSGGVTSIGSGVIVDADVNASAAITHSKLANITAGSVLMGNASNVPTATALSGDITVGSTGVTAIASGVIVNADINASAAIDKTKISGTAITAGDTGTVTSTMIADGTIVNADINASAAIEQNKIADSIIDTKTANYTLVLTDKNKFIEMNVGSANTVSIPTDASVNFPIGSQINITQYGTGKTQVVAVTPGTTSVRSTPGAFLRAQYSSATIIKRAANEWYLIGDLSAS